MMGELQKKIMGAIYGENIWGSADLSKASKGDLQGWNGDHPSLSYLASDRRPCVIDIGVWKGQSTLTLAKALKAADCDGCVIAIDTFLGSPEHWVGDFQNLFLRHGGRPNLYETFLSNVCDAGVTDIVVPLPQTSTTAAAILRAYSIEAHLIHVDAAHEYEDVKRDAHLYWDLLMPGGYMIGDDYAPYWPGVIKAADEFAREKALPLKIDGPKWIIRKPI